MVKIDFFDEIYDCHAHITITKHYMAGHVSRARQAL